MDSVETKSKSYPDYVITPYEQDNYRLADSLGRDEQNPVSVPGDTSYEIAGKASSTPQEGLKV